MIHSLSTEQLRILVGAFGGNKDWPSFTFDPLVNYVVDCVTSNDEDIIEYDEKSYIEEIKQAPNIVASQEQ